MIDSIDKELKYRIELVTEINRAKFKLLEIAISGLLAIKEQGNPIAQQTLDEMIASIPDSLEVDVHSEIGKILDK
tara:strand:- start:642 stop:866 length:225 start_codon:yes stop_codon:yes gene_type:complete